MDAMRRAAEAKLAQAELTRWVPTFEMTAVGGIVPDAKLDNKNDVNSYRSFDLENDFSFSRLGPFTRIEVEAIQPIYTFGKISGYMELAERNVQLTTFERKKKVGELRQLVKRAYYTLQLALDSEAILNDVQSKLNEAAEKVEQLLIKNADNVSEVDRLKIRVFLADVKNRSVEAVRGQRLSRSALSEITGVSGDWTPDQSGLVAEQVTSINKEDVISMALRSKPELSQLEEAIHMKEAEKRTIQADMYPTFFIGGRLQYAVAPGRTDIKNPFLNDQFNFFDVGALVGLKQDLGIFRTFKKVEGVQAEIDRIRAQREQFLSKVRLDVEKSFEEALGSQEAIKVNEDGFRAARSWLTSAGLSFNLGTSDTKDVLESFAAYFKARVDLMRSVYSLNMSLAELSQVVGVEVVDRLKEGVAAP